MLQGRSYANEPVYVCNRDSLYMIKHDGVWVSVSCLGHDSDECALQAIRKFRSEPRRAGKHKWQVIWCSMAVSDASDRPEQSASNLSGRGS